MKKITINAYQIGLVFKNGVYLRMLKEGVYWLRLNKTVYVYELSKPFDPPCELNILMQDAGLLDLLHVVEVRDHGFALEYENGLLRRVLTAGRYPLWEGVFRVGVGFWGTPQNA